MPNISLIVRPIFLFLGQDDYEWSISVAGASIDEGETMVHTVSLDRNGVTPEADEIITIDIRTPTPEEFAVAFPGQTQAISTDFSQSYTSLIKSLVASTTGMVSATDLANGLRLTFSAAWNGTFAFTRTTLNQAEEQGDKRSSFVIENPSHGTITDGEANYEIIDTFVEPIELVPTTIVIDTDYHYPGAAAGTKVGTVSVLDQEDDQIAVDSLTLLDTLGGRYAMDGADLELTAVAADFEGEPQAFYENNTIGIPHYDLPFQAVKGATTIQQTVRIRYRAPEINPNGGDGGTVSNPASTGDLRTAITSDTPNREVRIPASFFKSENNGNFTVLMDAANKSLYGHERHIFLRDGRITVDSNGFKIVNIVAAAGGDIAGNTPDNRDSGEFRRAKNGLISYCTFRHSLDELVSVISGLGPFCRNLRFYRCLFLDPMFATLDTTNYVKHSEGNHAYGPISYNYQMNIVFDQCVFIGTRQRAPLLNKGRGLLVQNCFMAYDGTGATQWATAFSSSASSKEINTNLTGIVRGNLYYPVSGAPRANAIVANKIGTGAYCHIPTTGNYLNHFIDPIDGATLNDDPITSVTLLNSDAAAIVGYEPFVPFYDPERTDGTANKLALRNLLIGRDDMMVGARVGADDDDPQPGYANMNKYDGTALNKLVTTRAINRPKPEDLARDWGTDWLGGTNTVTGLPAAIGNMTDLYT